MVGDEREMPHATVENPYIVAQKFIEQENLDQNFLEQIAKFIEQNAGVSANQKLPTQQHQTGQAHRPTAGQSEQHATLGSSVRFALLLYTRSF